MRRAIQILLSAILLLCVGCDLREFSPRWHSLTKKGVSYDLGEYHSANYLHGASDEQFAAAVQDLQKARVKDLDFQHTELSDQSINGVLQLRCLETLSVSGTNFTADGLTRLSGLPRLKRLYVAEGQFTEDELSRIQGALPTVDVRLTPTGAYRFRKPSTQTGPTTLAS